MSLLRQRVPFCCQMRCRLSSWNWSKDWMPKVCQGCGLPVDSLCIWLSCCLWPSHKMRNWLRSRLSDTYLSGRIPRGYQSGNNLHWMWEGCGSNNLPIDPMCIGDSSFLQSREKGMFLQPRRWKDDLLCCHWVFSRFKPLLEYHNRDLQLHEECQASWSSCRRPSYLAGLSKYHILCCRSTQGR